MNRFFALCGVAAFASSCVFAQSISSFQNVTSMDGINVTKLTSTSVKLSLAAGASFVYLGNTYTVDRVFGLWALDMNDDMTASGSAQNAWSFDSNYASTGGIAGWKTNPNQGQAPASSQTFNYASLAGTVEGFGAHIRTVQNLPGGGNTAYFKVAALPEPSSAALIAIGGIGMLIRRRKA